jgi:pimeloyl-ACP methyl ester carboxylesterase
MKKTLLLIFTVLTALATYAQDITGQWNGALKIQGTQLRIVFHIVAVEGGYSSTMDSPDQGVEGIPVTSTTFENSTLKLSVMNAALEYEGVLGKDNIIVGEVRQSGQTFSIDLSREAIEKTTMSRPQEPIEPYAYYSEDITFENTQAGHSLAGTLTLPTKDGLFPVVVLISGSGPQNRDEALLGHKPFLVLSDHLTKNGIAVLRFDDRGTGLSQGDFQTATTADLATDVEAAVQYLKTRAEIDQKKIGLVGHSEGGIIAPMVASRCKAIDFIVLLAGPGISGDQLLLSQQVLIGRASGISEEALEKGRVTNKKLFELVIQSTSSEQLVIDLTNALKQTLEGNRGAELPPGVSEDDFVSAQVSQIASPWMQYFIKYDPAPTLQKVKCPVLAINGERDLQVHPTENLAGIATALQKGRNKNVTTKELPALNHLFQTCETGSPSEYAQIEETFSPVALAEILVWINEQVK